MRKIGIGLTAALFIAAVAAPALATPPIRPGDEPLVDGHKITICHATSSSNPAQFWEIITVDLVSASHFRKVQAHLQHALEPNKKNLRPDLIPYFTYGTDFTFDGAPLLPLEGQAAADWAAFLATDPKDGDPTACLVREDDGETEG